MEVELVPALDYSGLVSLMELVVGIKVIDFDQRSLKSLRTMWSESQNRDAKIGYSSQTNSICGISHKIKILASSPSGGCWLEIGRKYYLSHLRQQYPEIEPLYIPGIKSWTLSETSKRDDAMYQGGESSIETALRAIEEEEIKHILQALGVSNINRNELRERAGLKNSVPVPRNSSVFYKVKRFDYNTMVRWDTTLPLPNQIVIRNDSDVDVFVQYFPEPPAETITALQDAWLPQ